jgi:hypothetical protein
MLRLRATKDMGMATAYLSHSKGRHCSCETRHSVDLAEEASLAAECLAPREDIALLGDGNREVWSSSNEFHIMAFQSRHFCEFGYILRAAVACTSVDGTTFGVDIA